MSSTAPTAPEITASSEHQPSSRRRRNRPRPGGQASGEVPPPGSEDRPNRSNPPRNRPARSTEDRSHPASRDGGSQGPPREPQSSQSRPRRNRPARQPDSERSAPASDGSNVGNDAPARNDRKPRNRRAVNFNANLTEPSQQATSGSSKPEDNRPSVRYRAPAPKKDDLTSTLIHALSTSPYPDCLICFSAIHPAQPTWSCSPLIPISSTEDETDGMHSRSGDTAQCCWTTFHLKCIRSWASKSVKDVADAWRARGESRPGEWRCPGCQSKRLIVPNGYWCFCGYMPDPKHARLSTPHSCGGPCTRPRVCGHPCSLACHPGPCPPCQVTTQIPCYCGSKTISFKCSHLHPGKTGQRLVVDLSCGRVCGKWLPCGNHQCADVCHDGDCLPCTVTVESKCYCGKHSKELGCGEGTDKISSIHENGVENTWTGRFACEEPCDRAFDCGIHHCSKPCHPLTPGLVPCPRSPNIVSHCPCGKHELDSSSKSSFPPGTVLPRTACTDPIPTCESLCMKSLEGCSHLCSSKCHIGPCPPCSIMIVRPCRCGSTTRDIRCSDNQAQALVRERGEPGNEILCDKPCTALRACGRHQCNRVCCPLASLASVSKGKGKKKVTATLRDVTDDAGWHECDLLCGKMLSCGNHTCEERDHKGACPPCLRSSFEEMICCCGRTILEPPIPCGTRINCTYPCARPRLPCGHQKIPHACHEDPIPCPPCPILISKTCACGKKEVGNVRCLQEKVSCGTVCGRLLPCGFHHCERLCHGDACGACNAICGKPRKLCLPGSHSCTLPCHAPSSCSETEPCQAIIHISCPCGRIRQPIQCGRSTTNPAGRESSQNLKCTNDCLIAKRNARLAEALGITPDRTSEGKLQLITFNDDLLTFGKSDVKFLGMVEKSFADFIGSDKKSQVLAHMTETRRRFVQELASVYRMDAQMVDQEPNRSVQLIRRIDTRIPTPLLSSVVASSTHPISVRPNSGLGKLTDLRTAGPLPRSIPPSRSQTSTPVPSASTSSSRGWTSVVARSQQSTPKPENPTAWLTGPNPHPATIRNVSPAPITTLPRPTPPIAPARPTAAPVEDVPDSWEDDA